MTKLGFRPRFTIGTKLVGLLALLLMSSVLSLVMLSSQMFVESDTALIQQANSDAAANLATQMRELFLATTEKMRILGTVLTQTSVNPDKERLIGEFFSKDKDLLAVYLEGIDKAGTVTLVARGLSPEMLGINDVRGEDTLAAARADPNFSLNTVAAGEAQLSSLNLPDGEPAISLAIPFVEDPNEPGRFTHILIAIMRQTRFLKAFSDSEVVTSFMVDRRGKVLAHPDPDVVTTKENFSNLPIVKELLSGKFNNGQTRYVDPRTGEARLGAFRVVGFGGLGVVAEVAEAKAFEGASKVVYRAALVAWMILCVAFLTGYLYSGTITWPIRRLADAANRISKGDFKINLTAKGRDELAHLSTTFNEMAQGLVERDRVKETFNKFHNREIAEKLLSGEVKLGGERKEATVFFSDVRGFTGMSESMEPEQVVEMLNEYMTRMVGIIRSYKGVVDKYVGDAIMAIWGVPISKEDDCYNAVRACIAMREDLAKLNDLRISRGQPVIKIGMGLNSGPLIAGNIGSNEKMEYTVIGDAVNLASRIESMTKEYGTDLLISKSIYEKIQDRFIFEKAASTRVKGKAEPIDIYKVTGYIDETGAEVLVSTPYSSYKAEKSDKVVHEEGTKEHAEPLELASAPAPVTAAGGIELLGPQVAFDLTQQITLPTEPSEQTPEETPSPAQSEISEEPPAPQSLTPPPPPKNAKS